MKPLRLDTPEAWAALEEALMSSGWPEVTAFLLTGDEDVAGARREDAEDPGHEMEDEG